MQARWFRHSLHDLVPLNVWQRDQKNRKAYVRAWSRPGRNRKARAAVRVNPRNGAAIEKTPKGSRRLRWLRWHGHNWCASNVERKRSAMRRQETPDWNRNATGAFAAAKVRHCG